MLFDFATMKERDIYKLLVSTVVPRPIAWVVTRDLNGTLNAAPFSFFNVLSSDPPLVAIGIGGHSPGHVKDTGDNIRRHGQFTVCLVDAARAEAMNVTAVEFGPEVDEIAEAGLTIAPSTRIDVPRIAESPVALECERFATLEVSNQRALVLGHVVAMHIRDDCVLDPARAYVDTPRLDLIGRMHGAGGYTYTREQFQMARMTPAQWAERKAGE